jgi:Chaperone of endosialidase
MRIAMPSFARILMTTVVLLAMAAPSYAEPPGNAARMRPDQTSPIRGSVQTGWNTWVPNASVGGGAGLVYQGHMQVRAPNGRSMTMTGNGVDFSSGLPLNLPGSNVVIGAGDLRITNGNVSVTTGSLTTGAGDIATSSGNIRTNSGTVSAPNGNIAALSAGSLTVSNSVSANFFYLGSDRALKENIARMDGSDGRPDGLAIVRQLSGYRFAYKADGRGSAGVMAQELAPLMAELVTTHPETGTMQVNYSGLFAPTLEAIKSLDARSARSQAAISTLEDRLARLERHLGTLQTENASLRASLARTGLARTSPARTSPDARHAHGDEADGVARLSFP